MDQVKKINKPYPVVVMIGRTNVGKSTIFNRLTENKKAIVSNIAGTTRDRRYGECLWQGQTITLVDTAGLDISSEEAIDKESVKHSLQALKEADLVLFVVNGQEPFTTQDREYNKILQKSHKPTLLVINKVDAKRQRDNIADFYKLGYKEIYPISAKNGSGTGDLLDAIYESLDRTNPGTTQTMDEQKENHIRITLLGKPNVGKSSLINKILGEERAIVSSLPHTTRDSQDISVEYDTGEEKYLLTFVDTAGMIKNRKIQNKLQELSIARSIENLKKSDLVLLLIDAGEPISVQDKNISREILENDKSVIFVVNKWDLVDDKDIHSDKKFTNFIFQHFPYLTWAPVVFISALTGAKITRLLDVIIEIYKSQYQNVSESQLNKFLKYIVRHQAPRKAKGMKKPYIHEIKQTSKNPLSFEVIGDLAENIHFSYQRYIENELRKRFHYDGCGIRIHFQEREHKKSHQT